MPSSRRKFPRRRQGGASTRPSMERCGSDGAASSSAFSFPSNISNNSNSNNTIPHASKLLSLHVRVLAQDLGVENEWAQRGAGTLELCGLVIRVIAPRNNNNNNNNNSNNNGARSRRSSTSSSNSNSIENNNTDNNTNTDINTAEVKEILGVNEEHLIKDNEVPQEEVTPLEEAEGETRELVRITTEPSLMDDDDDDDFMQEKIILEDTITEETPFVGENCCIVWNSIDKQQSLCLMFASQEIFSASWSALVAMQQKVYPPIRFDVLRLCKPSSTTIEIQESDNENEGEISLNVEENNNNNNIKNKLLELYSEENYDVLPYSYFIHNQYSPPLGFIERHVISLSIMENGHALNPELYKDPKTVLTLLSISNGDLLEHFVTEEVYPFLVKCLNLKEPEPWEIPQGLSNLKVSEDFSSLLNKALRLQYLESDLSQNDISEEVREIIIFVSRRLQNEAVFRILTNEDLLKQAKDALLIIPPAISTTSGSRQRGLNIERSGSTMSVASEETPKKISSPSSNTWDQALRAEQQVLAHLRFFRTLIDLVSSSFAKDLIVPLISKIFMVGLLEALSLVAERFGMPQGSSAVFNSSISKGIGVSNNREGVEDEEQGNVKKRLLSISNNSINSNFYSLVIEQELVALLDAVVMRLNDRQKDTVMNERIRIPIMNNPSMYNGIMTFLLRQLVLGYGGGLIKKTLREPMNCSNPYLIFHILGLQEDGPVAPERTGLDSDSIDKRNKFHTFFIQKYLIQCVRGVIVSVPPPPTNVSNVNRPTPMMQINSTVNSLNSLPQGISPPFIRVLDFIISHASSENVELVLKAIFHSKSRIMQFIEVCCEIATQNSKMVCGDVLASNIRLLRTVLTQITPAITISQRRFDCATPFGMDTPFGTLSCITSSVSKQLVTAICRGLTVERDTFGIIFKAYNALGGSRKNTIFHSSVLALLEFIDKNIPAMIPTEPGTNNLRDIRDYLFFKHREIMPIMFSTRFNQSMLIEIKTRLGHDEAFSPNASICTASSSSSGFGTSKLRYVDELESTDAFNNNNNNNNNGGIKSGVNYDENAASFPKKIRALVEQISPITSPVSSLPKSDLAPPIIQLPSVIPVKGSGNPTCFPEPPAGAPHSPRRRSLSNNSSNNNNNNSDSNCSEGVKSQEVDINNNNNEDDDDDDEKNAELSQGNLSIDSQSSSSNNTNSPTKNGVVGQEEETKKEEEEEKNNEDKDTEEGKTEKEDKKEKKDKVLSNKSPSPSPLHNISSDGEEAWVHVTLSAATPRPLRPIASRRRKNNNKNNNKRNESASPPLPQSQQPRRRVTLPREDERREREIESERVRGK